MSYKIVLADDHELMLQGIRSILAGLPGFEVIASVENGHAVLREVATSHPDLVILDLNMPELDGIETLKRIKATHPHIKVMILTSYQQPEMVEELKSLRADGYLVKNSTSSELKEAIIAIASGEKIFPATRSLIPLQEDSHYFDDFLKKYQLTKREVEIIRLVCEGLSSKEIASKLFLSEFTINTHRKNILRKVDSRNIAGLIQFAKSNLLI